MFQTVNGIARPGLVLLSPTGDLDTSFDPHLEDGAAVFCLVEDDQGRVLVGGRMRRQNVPGWRMLARLKPDLSWDEEFTTDDFATDDAFLGEQGIKSVLLQTDGKLVVAGCFYEVGGYWRRHLVRLDSQGHVDPCFDPGLGLGDFYGAHSLAQQADGRILVGGWFYGFDGIVAIDNLVRVLPQNECNATRVHLVRYPSGGMIAAGTCPPGGTNLLQMSTNLVDWTTVISQTNPYSICFPSSETIPAAFFRVKKEF